MFQKNSAKLVSYSYLHNIEGGIGMLASSSGMLPVPALCKWLESMYSRMQIGMSGFKIIHE